MASPDQIPGIGPALRAALADIGITSTQDLATADAARLTQLRGISPGRAETFIAAAKSIAQGDAGASATDPGAAKKNGKAEKKKAQKAKGDKAAVKAEPSVKKAKDKKKKKSEKTKAKGKAAKKSKK